MIDYQEELLPVFWSECQKNLTEIRDAIGQVQGGSCGSDVYRRLHRAAHTVKGNAGVMGLHDIEQAARTLETCASSMEEMSISPAGSAATVLEEAYAALEGIVTRVTV